MGRQRVRFVVLALGVLVALTLAMAPAYAWGTGDNGVQCPGTANKVAQCPGTGNEAVQFPGIGEGNWQPIGSEPLEFDLAYPGNDEGAEIQLASDPGSRVGFKVYTDWAWKQLGAGNTDVTPVGVGTSNPHAGDNLTWKVNASASELYHIQVYLIGMEPARFWIKQQGSGNSVFWAVSPLPEQP